MRKIILFVPGYYGSTLIEKNTSKKRWVNILDFFLSQKGIPTSVPGTSIKADADLIPHDVLEYVHIVPPFLKIDSYGNTLKLLREFASKNNMIIENAPYDWREDFITSIKLIDEKIATLKLTQKDELYVVAHSTGALLISYYLRYGTQDVYGAHENWYGLKFIKKAVLASAPFHGLMVLLRDTEVGTPKGINKNLMSARDYSSFKSSYMFLPPPGEDLVIDEKTKKPIQLHLHNPETWEKNNWGVFKFIKDHERKAGLDFISTCMSRSEKFHQLLRAEIIFPPPINFPLFYTYGNGHKTIQQGYLRHDKKTLLPKVDFNRPDSLVDGDGTVTTESSKPLAYFKNFNLTLHKTNLTHLEIISSKKNQQNMYDFLLKIN